MTCEKYLVVAILACTAFVVVAKPSGMALQTAIDKTICRTKVEYDVNKNRIPKVIKIIKCEDDPYEMCPASNGEDMRCCGAKFSCVELLDDVLVRHAGSEDDDVIRVAVGCSCIKQNPSRAISV